MSDKKFKLLVYGIAGGVVMILLIILGVVLNSVNEKVESGVNIVNDAGDEMIKGAAENAKIIEKVEDLMDKNPFLRELPKTVEYFSEDYSKYTKYVVSYELDESEAGYYIIIKDYSGEGEEAIFKELREWGVGEDVMVEYRDLTGDRLNARGE